MSGGKLKDTVRGGRGSAADKYFAVTYGPMPRWKAVLAELTCLLLTNLPGAAGLFLRSRAYRFFLGECGRGVVIGRGVTFRHPGKIRLGNGVILDDGCVVDAKGDGNAGITMGDGCYVGRNSIVYCKGGSITLEEGVNISANCILFSSNSLTVGSGCMIGAYCYFLSGGEYDVDSDAPFAAQSGMKTAGPMVIGSNCWFGARVTVLDAAGNVGADCVFGAGAVVTRSVPERSVCVGVPARAVRKRM